jgi:hypothetical protein
LEKKLVKKFNGLDKGTFLEYFLRRDDKILLKGAQNEKDLGCGFRSARICIHLKRERCARNGDYYR